MTRRHSLSMIAITALAALIAAPPLDAGDTFKWTVQYLVDNSQPVFGRSQKIWPRRNRGLAMSPDGQFLYLGYHHGADGVGEVRKIAIGITDDYSRATAASLSGPLGKAIACDDKGRVYIANEGEILVFDANLSESLGVIGVSKAEGVRCEGVAVVRSGDELALYASSRSSGTLYRLVISEKDGSISASLSNGFGENGVVAIPGAISLRGVEVDSKGGIWVADAEANKVFFITKDGKQIKSVDVPRAMDVAVDGSRAYVSRGLDRQVAVIETDSLNLLGNLAVPWDELELAPTGNAFLGALGGIVAIPGKGFFTTNESGQTAHFKSTYGKVDGNSDKVGSVVYRDAFLDDNDPVLRALEVKE